MLIRVASAGLLALVLAFAEWGCGGGDSSAKNLPSENQPAPAGLFRVSQQQLGHLQIGPVRSSTWQINVETTGTVDWDADRTTQAITQASGPITRILVDTGSRVKAGQPLLYVNSPDVANSIATYKKARDQRNLAEKALEREKNLLAHGAAALKDVEIAQAGYDEAVTDVENSMQTLKIFAITPREIEAAESQGSPINPELALRAPIAGTVVQKLVMPGQVIQAGATTCFVLSDTSRLWVQGHLFDRDLPLVQMGDTVDETVSSLPEIFHGRVAYIGAIVDPATRTTPVRIVTQNRGDLLKQGMYVDAIIHTRTARNVLNIPVSAVLHNAENEPFVYVEVKPREFARRPVTVGMQQNGNVEIRSGLKEGEPVVSEGSVFLQFAGSYQ